MIFTAWSNDSNGFGFKVSKKDRDLYFDNTLGCVTLELPIENGFQNITVNIDKDSFWRGNCRELISVEIKNWLKKNELLNWEDRKPPKFNATKIGINRFRITL